MACQKCSCHLLKLIVALLLHSTNGALDFRYHNEQQMQEYLNNLNLAHPNLTRVYSIGKSVQGRALLVLAIGSHVHRPAPLIPNVKYVANMHGNEVVGREMLLHLAEHLLTGYSINQTIQQFLDTTNIHLLPCLNPDGFHISRPIDCQGYIGRNNSNDYDLNRNFPDILSPVPSPVIQPETAAVLNWTRAMHFVLSANLHGGALVVNYPFDAYPGDLARQKYSPTPDDDVFKHLALVFSRSHAVMYKGHSCNEHFIDGITNGAAWYSVLGGMQDYMYRHASTYEVLVEMSCCKYPRAAVLPNYWSYNKDALINYLMSVHMGVKGIVYGSAPDTSDPLVLQGATVVVQGREGITFHTTEWGEYYKLLLPGDYVLMVSHPEYQNQSRHFRVEPSTVTRLDIVLSHQLINMATATTCWNSCFIHLIFFIWLVIKFIAY